MLLTQADIGGGSAFTWSALAGLQFQIKPWVGLAAGYNVLRIDTGNVPKTGNAAVNDLQYAVTQHGPALLADVSLGGARDLRFTSSTLPADPIETSASPDRIMYQKRMTPAWPPTWSAGRS
jgi:hypothetical protein